MDENILKRKVEFDSKGEVKIEGDNNQLEPKKKETINVFFQKTLKNTLSACGLSLIASIVSFLCNIPLLRKISKDNFGIAKVYFELAFLLSNNVPRETLRKASQKFCPDKDPEKEEQKLIAISQMSYLFMLFDSLACIIIFFCFMFLTDSQKLHDNYIQLSIYIIFSFLELMIEPVAMYMNLHMENKFLPIITSSMSRVISNTFFAIVFDMDLWSFTMSRIVGSSCYILFNLYLGIFKYKLNFYQFIPKNYKSLLFDKSTENGIDTLYLREVLFQFIKLNLLNLILTKCQNLILSFIIKSSDEEKSDYSFIIQNYSTLSKFLLQPIVDAFYNLVNKIKYIEKKGDEYVRQMDIREEKDINKMTEGKNDNKKYELQLKQDEDNNESPKTEELVVEEDNENKNENTEEKKEINYDISLKLLQFFFKIISHLAIFIIPYYILIGTEIMGLIYGQNWQTNNIDKIGDCYSYFVIFLAISDLITSFGNATNDTHQMNLSYISLIVNAIFLTFSSSVLSRWDICGIILANVLSNIFLIHYNYYIIFCGKKIVNDNLSINEKDSILFDITNFFKKCFMTKRSMLTTFISIVIGNLIKKVLLVNSKGGIKILSVMFVGLINIILVYFFEKKNFFEALNEIKSYQ